ncbi:MAG: hypothetical protein BJ554DRAFT_6076, partial [Olpidium bornovanus]
PTGPLAISVIKDGDRGYKALVRTTKGSERILVPADAVKEPVLRKLFGLGPSTTAILHYKFGLTYLAKEQCKEEEMFRNRMGKSRFKEFLNFLGETIELRGWRGYRAGLDVVQDHTGKQSVYTKWQGYEIMFHVSPMLPFAENDSQQLERKRHIGNDIVIIIFQQEGSVPFKLETITSKQ